MREKRGDKIFLKSESVMDTEKWVMCTFCGLMRRESLFFMFVKEDYGINIQE